MEERDALTLSKDHVIQLYQELLGLLKSDEFGDYLEEVLNKSYPNYFDVLEKRKEDMEKGDQGIVIAGETSSGKSTLINKILKKNVLKSRTKESTATICKLRNSEKITIKVEDKNKKVEELDIPEDIDLETPEGISKLSEELTKYTESSECNCVDIGLPLPFLKGNVIIVDTPGIGGSGDMTQKLMDYLPNALSLIFVVNAGSPAGMQGDRLPVILQSLTLLQIDNEMPCFNPEDVLFITNKWDTIVNASSESESEMEAETMETWETLKQQIKFQWQSVKEENIFKLSLKEVSDKKENVSTEQFKEFLKKLDVMIRDADHVRVVKHIHFLRGILGDLESMINQCCKLKQSDRQEHNVAVKKKQELLKDTKEECKEFTHKVRIKTKELEEEMARDAQNYMSTEKGKEQVLNPQGSIPILNVKYSNPQLYSQEVGSRVHLYVAKVMKSDKFVKRFEEIREMIKSFYIKTCNKLDEKLENDSGSLRMNPKVPTGKSPTSENHHALYAVPILLTGFISLPLTFFLAGAYIVLTLSITKTKIRIVENSYGKYVELVCKKLEEESCDILRKMIDKVMSDVLPRRIEAFEKRTEKFQVSRERICAEHKTLVNLVEKVKIMKSTVNIINQNLNVRGLVKKTE